MNNNINYTMSDNEAKNLLCYLFDFENLYLKLNTDTDIIKDIKELRYKLMNQYKEQSE